jgi:hypothetical protein
VVTPHVFAVKSDSGQKHEGVRRLKKTNPDKFNVSTPPIGTTPQLQAEAEARGLAEDGDRGCRAAATRRRRCSPAPMQLNSGTLAPALESGRHVTGVGADRRQALVGLPTSRP